MQSQLLQRKRWVCFSQKLKLCAVRWKVEIVRKDATQFPQKVGDLTVKGVDESWLGHATLLTRDTLKLVVACLFHGFHARRNVVVASLLSALVTLLGLRFLRRGSSHDPRDEAEHVLVSHVLTGLVPRGIAVRERSLALKGPRLEVSGTRGGTGCNTSRLPSLLNRDFAPSRYRLRNVRVDILADIHVLRVRDVEGWDALEKRRELTPLPSIDRHDPAQRLLLELAEGLDDLGRIRTTRAHE